MRHQTQDAPVGARPRAPSAVRVSAPGRLHIGFLDLNGSLGRRFGSLGLTLREPATRVLVQRAEETSASGPDAERALEALMRLKAAGGLAFDVRATVEQALPPHSGLGSGTQLALAVGVGASMLSERPLPAREIARLTSRGARSSIGLGAFEGGGVLLDGGQPLSPGPTGHQPPPLLSRIAVPESWRILLIFDTTRAGLSGEGETQAMDRLPPFPDALADRLCRLALMGALPAAATGDAHAFGVAIAEMQRRIGDHFAPFQGGRFTSADVADALEAIAARGAPGVGQSSWGPTGFAVFGDAADAEAAAAELRLRFADRANLRFEVTSGDNRGATIEPLPLAAGAA